MKAGKRVGMKSSLTWSHTPSKVSTSPPTSTCSNNHNPPAKTTSFVKPPLNLLCGASISLNSPTTSTERSNVRPSAGQGKRQTASCLGCCMALILGEVHSILFLFSAVVPVYSDWDNSSFSPLSTQKEPSRPCG